MAHVAAVVPTDIIWPDTVIEYEPTEVFNCAGNMVKFTNLY